MSHSSKENVPVGEGTAVTHRKEASIHSVIADLRVLREDMGALLTRLPVKNAEDWTDRLGMAIAQLEYVGEEKE